MTFKGVAFAFVVIVVSFLVAGCGSAGDGAASQGQGSSSLMAQQVDSPVIRNAPVSVVSTDDETFLLTLGPADGPNLWLLEPRTSDIANVEGVRHLTDVFAGRGVLWGITSDIERGVEVSYIDPHKPDPWRVRLDVPCFNGTGWVLDTSFWLRCGPMLYLFRPKTETPVRTVSVEDRSLILRVGNTLWQAESKGFLAIAGEDAGRFIAVGFNEDGPWATSGVEAWAISSTPSGGPALKRVDFSRGTTDLFPIETNSATPLDLVLTKSEVWVTVLPQPIVYRYDRTAPGEPKGTIQLPQRVEDSADWGLELGAGREAVWLTLRVGSALSLFRAAIEPAAGGG